MAIQGFFTGDVKIRDLNGVLKAVDGIVEVATDAGTVTSVGLTVGSTGTDVNVANSPVTTSGNITLNLPTASATNRGLLSSADWTTFNSKQGAITLTTTGSSGAATLIGTTLNIPNYTGALAGYVPYTGATTNVNLGEYGISSGYFQADLTPSGSLQVGRMQWNSTDGTMDLRLMGNNVTLQIGQEQVARVVNGTGGNLLEANYQAVKIIGAQGQRLQVGLARADNDANSKDTLGLVTENINNNQEGFITVSGLVNEINTTGSLQGETWADGDTLYLSGTTSGAITNVKPTAPIHTVIVGFVVYAHQNHGKIFVKVDNGYELEELHDVAPTPYVNKGVLYRDTATNLWKSATIGTLLGYTPANAATTLTINGTAYDLSANRTWNVGTVTSIGTSGPLTGGTITGSGTIGITQSSAASDGYLSNTDWATFNNKQTALNGTGFVKISGTTISYDNSTYYLASNPSAYIALTALSTTSPLSYNNTTGVFSISQATTSTNGYLSSTDWNTFNNKQAAGSYITALTGEATASGPGSATVTLGTSAVTGKLLTGLNLTGGGSIAATDSILQAFGKVQNQISGLAGGVTYQGTWNASTNTPTLTSSVGTKGYYYIVSVAGSTNLNGITDWKIGDWAIFNGTTWDKVDNTDAVSSVNGFTGAVSLTTSNISEGTNLYYLDSRARLALSFTAGSGAYNSTTGVITIPTNTNQLTNGANYITLASLSAGAGISYNNTTGVIASTITQYTDAMARAAISGGTGISYNSTTGVITNTITQYTDAMARASISLTTTGTSGAATYNSTTGVLNVPQYAPDLSGYVPTSRTLTINGTAFDLSANRSWSVGTVTSVGLSSATSGVTIGSTPVTTSGTITLAIATASGSQQGLLSSTDWTTFNNKQNALTNPVTGTGTTNYLPKFTGTSTIGNSLVYDNGTAVAIGGTTMNVTGLNVQTSGANLTGTTAYVNINAAVSGYGLSIGGDGTRQAGVISGYQGIDFYTYNGGWTRSLTLNYVGNLGLGVTPSAWDTTLSKAIQLNGGSLWGYSTSQINLLQNAFYNTSGDIAYVNSASASAYRQISGVHSWHTAPSGTAGNAISFTQAMTLDANGRLGIGATSMTYSLQVNDVAGGNMFRFASGSTVLDYYVSGGNPSFGTASNHDLRFRTNDTTRLTLASTGAATFSSSVTATELYLSTSNGLIGNINSSNANGGYITWQTSGTIIADIGTANQIFGSGGSDVFGINGRGARAIAFGTNNTERMRITSGGNVGIGTSSPANYYSTKLVVAVGDEDGITIAGSGDNFLMFADGQTGLDRYRGFIHYNHDSNFLAFGSDATERMRITSGGTLLVGTTSEAFAGGKLQVEGTIRAAGQFTSVLPSSNFGYFDGSGQVVASASSASSLYLDATWNTTGNPDAIFLNITNTASGASAKLLNLKVGSVSQFNVSKAGAITTGALTNGTAQPWKLGNAVSGSLSTNHYIIVEINGTTYSIPALQGLP